MRNKVVKINQNDVSVKEYKGQRVVTLKDIDIVHERAEGTAGRNFRENREHFIESEDYFMVCADEIRRNKIMDVSAKAHQDIVFLTESGYLMLVKSFTDDLAWNVQRQLIKSYFKTKKQEKAEEKKKSEHLASVNNAVKILTPLLEAAGCTPQIQLLTAKSLYEKAGVSLPIEIPADKHFVDTVHIVI